MTGDIVTFHAHRGLYYAFIGVHMVGLAAEDGRWLFALDGDATWRRSVGDVANAKAAITREARNWYDAAHQPLAEGQAERLCGTPARLLRPRKELRIKEIDPEAIALRIKRDGVLYTYVMPPVVDGIEAPPATVNQIRAYFVGAADVAEAKCRANPADRLAEHEFTIFTGVVRLVDSIRASTLIRDELARIAAERARAAQASEPDRDGDEETRVDSSDDIDQASAV